MEVKKVLETIVKDLLAKEGLSEELLERVDLDVAYSPVLAVRGERLEDAVEVVKTLGDKYLVRHPLCNEPVSADVLKVMRLRWLLARDVIAKEKMKRLFGF